MDLTLIKQEAPSQEKKGGIRQAVYDGCWVHPSTLIDLRVPALGLVAVQHPLLFDGATTYQQCLPLESIPQGSIQLSLWVAGHVPQELSSVRVEGIHVDVPCKLHLFCLVYTRAWINKRSDGAIEPDAAMPLF